MSFSLTAVGTGREVTLESPGVATLFICFSQETQAGIAEVEAAARERFPDVASLLVAHVIDLHKIPGLFRKVAEATLKSEFDKAVAGLVPGQDPNDYVVMLPDWDGAAVAALGLEDATKQLGLALVAPAGPVLGRHQADGPVEAVTRLLESLPDG